MSDIARAIADQLLTVTDVTDLVGTRVRVELAQSNDFRDTDNNLRAYIVIRVISNPDEHTQTGPASLSQSRLQIDCHSESSGRSNQVATAVSAALNGLTDQTMGAQALEVRSVRKSNGPIHDSSVATDGSERHIFNALLEFLSWHA